jgi:glycosyltransferase involved in cell wall biosynthesis
VYNEQTRIADVLKQVSRTKKISEIICVDDGSTDKSAEVIKKYFPKVIQINHKTNLGKTAAIASGLKLVKEETLLLLDSDLINLNYQEIDRAIAIFERENLDCLLLNTVPPNFTVRLVCLMSRFPLTVAGNRIIHKKCLTETLRKANFKSYYLEIAQNKYLMENNKKVAYFDISAIGVSKISKVGFFNGLWQEIIMWQQIIDYAGLVFLIKQSLVFAKRKVN